MASEKEGSDVRITYETIYELVRLEKDRAELQHLDEAFFANVEDYLSKKEEMLKSTDSANPFADQETEKTQLQLKNVKRLLKELYERREKKIIDMAINKSRASSSVINQSLLLAEEKEFYQRILTVLDDFRLNVLGSLLTGRKPTVPKQENKQAAVFTNPVAKAETPDGNVLVRFVGAVPKFVGPDLEVLGPFEEEDMATLPKSIVDILLDKKKVEVVKVE